MANDVPLQARGQLDFLARGLRQRALIGPARHAEAVPKQSGDGDQRGGYREERAASKVSHSVTPNLLPSSRGAKGAVAIQKQHVLT